MEECDLLALGSGTGDKILGLPGAVLYVVAQFSGAIAGVCAAKYLLPDTAGRRAVEYAVNAPGPSLLRKTASRQQ